MSTFLRIKNCVDAYFLLFSCVWTTPIALMALSIDLCTGSLEVRSLEEILGSVWDRLDGLEKLILTQIALTCVYKVRVIRAAAVQFGEKAAGAASTSEGDGHLLR